MSKESHYFHAEIPITAIQKVGVLSVRAVQVIQCKSKNIFMMYLCE